MRAIDHMTSEEVGVLKLKGMLSDQKAKSGGCSPDEIFDARLEAHIEAQEQAEDEESDLSEELDEVGLFRGYQGPSYGTGFEKHERVP